MDVRVPTFFSLAMVLCLSLVTAAGAQDRRILEIEDSDYQGFDYKTVKDTTLDACKSTCLSDKACRAFTFNTDAGWCFLKNDFGTLNSFAGAVAGRVVSTPEPDTDAPAVDTGFLPSGLVTDAAKFERSVTAAVPDAGDGYAASRAEARTALSQGNARLATQLLRRALAFDDSDPSVWLDLAAAYLAIEPSDYDERYRLPERATASALTALQRNGNATQRALALSLAGRALERRQMWRPAIESYRASLALLERQSVRAAFRRLRAEHGFRVLDYRVDLGGSTPRACVEFSEDLASETLEFGDFVTLDGARPPAVERESRQLCLDGLEFGTRYSIGLRAGLPSSIGETLEEPVELKVYVRDRSPSVRFTGRNYVLPRTGSRGIPVVSLNTELLEIDIYRIGGRNLVRALNGGGFLNQLSGYRAENIAEERGSRVWSGEMPVSLDRNTEVVTAFPVSEALPVREPGVYVLTAKTADAPVEDWNEQATQWFIVSDLGLTTLGGTDGLHVFTRSLESAAPSAGATLTLLARNNEVLATATADESGHARFAPGLMRGEGGDEPAALIAETADDDAFLDLARSPFDLSDRGVDGRPAPGPVDVFAYTERGVYRPGETVHFVTLARDNAGYALPDVPLTVVLERPDGVEQQRHVLSDDRIGGHALDIPLLADTMTGTWRARTYTDPDAEALSETKFLVEDFVPERLDFEIDSDADVAVAGEALPLELTGRFLYGAPAAGLRIEGEAVLRPSTTSPDAFPGYRFGLADQEVTPIRRNLEGLPVTDDNGRAQFDAVLPAGPQTTGRLEADVILRLREAGGRAVERTLTLPVKPDGPLIGIRPGFEDDQIGEGETATFDVVGLSPDIETIALGEATWELLQVRRRFDWYNLDGRWRYESTTYTERVAGGTIELDGSEPARIEAPVDYGRYRLEVAAAEPDGPASSVEFSAGWYVVSAAAETPDILDVALDRERYAPGETARVRIAPRFAGTALVTVMGEELLAMKAAEIGSEGGTVEFEVDERWGAGAYVTAMLYRPMDAEADLMPSRAIGVDWLGLDTSGRTLEVDLDVGGTAPPRETLTVPVRISGLEAGEQAHVTVAAVDLGILNLTRYEPPDPNAWYFGQRRLGMEIRDLYGQLIDGLQGARGQIRSGGGEAGLSLSGAPPTEAPLALFSGIVEVGADGTANVAFDLPAFNGTVRLMAVAWSAGRLGHAHADLVLRDPVVLTASLPRFLTPGDTSRLRLDIDNVDGPAGDWTVSVDTDGPVEIDGSGLADPLTLEAGQRTALDIPLSAAAIGRSAITVALEHGSGARFEKTVNLASIPAQPAITRYSRQTLAAGGDALTLSGDRLDGFVPGSAVLTVSMTRGLMVDMPGLLDALDRYPYGCVEQVTSQALPLLYLSDVSSALGLGSRDDIKKRVDDAIVRVLQRQGSGGSFGLWRAGGDDIWLNAYVSEFLTRAREAGYAVPDIAFDLAIDRLENSLSYAGQVEGGGEGIAYALYVLARNRRASIGDLRYYVDTKIDDFATPLAKAQLGAALSRYGEVERARTAFRAALADLREQSEDEPPRSDYGSRLRDGAATLALVAESSNVPVRLTPYARIVEAERLETTYASTQEQVWLLVAANAMLEADETIALDIDGTAHSGRFQRRYEQAAFADGPISIRNTSSAELEAVVTVRGVPEEPLAAESTSGLSIDRQYYTLDGEATDVSQVAQNQRLVAVIRVSERIARRAQLLIEDRLPAGFEIDNPRLVESGGTGSLAWLNVTPYVDHSEFRDDRFVAAFERNGNEAETLTLAYIVRAVSPGSFVHPPARVEDMYQPHVRANTATGTVEVIGPTAR